MENGECKTKQAFILNVAPGFSIEQPFFEFLTLPPL
jgi:hypothetical protein